MAAVLPRSRWECRATGLASGGLAEREMQDTRLEDSSEEVLMHGPLSLILRLESCRLVSSGGFRLRLVFELVGGAFAGRDVAALATIDRLVDRAAFFERVEELNLQEFRQKHIIDDFQIFEIFKNRQNGTVLIIGAH